jgi:hypothetical protein
MEVDYLLHGRSVASIQGLFYISEEVSSGPSLDSCELVLEGGGSVLFTSSTDWSLEASPGFWPNLPAWCWPKNAWSFAPLEIPRGDSRIGRIVRIERCLNEVGEASGIRIGFDEFELLIKSGDSVSIEFSS